MIDAIVDRHGRLDVSRQQRRRFALCLDRGVQREVQPQDHRAQSAWCAVGFPARQRHHAEPAGRRLDRQHLQSQRPAAVPGHRRVRRGEGRLGEPHADAWRWSGPEGAGERGVVGMVETEQSELFYGDAESIAAISKNVPLGRLATPADVGWAAAFLASDAASYISGASLGGAWRWRATALSGHHERQRNQVER